VSREEVRVAYDTLAAELDRIEARCIAIEVKEQAGEELTDEEQQTLNQWDAEGRTRWRKNPRVLAKVRRTAKMAARNARRRRLDS